MPLNWRAPGAIERLCVIAQIEEGLQQSRDGKVVSHDEVKSAFNRDPPRVYSRSRICRSTVSYITAVTVPVFVFCRDGWYIPIKL